MFGYNATEQTEPGKLSSRLLNIKQPANTTSLYNRRGSAIFSSDIIIPGDLDLQLARCIRRVVLETCCLYLIVIYSIGSGETT